MDKINKTRKSVNAATKNELDLSIEKIKEEAEAEQKAGKSVRVSHADNTDINRAARVSGMNSPGRAPLTGRIYSNIPLKTPTRAME